MDKEEINELERDIIEDHLADVAERLYDILSSFDALKYVAEREKRGLIQTGRPFVYQQAILDIVTELGRYGSGEASLKKDVEDLQEHIITEIERGREEEDDGGEGIYQ